MNLQIIVPTEEKFLMEAIILYSMIYHIKIWGVLFHEIIRVKNFFIIFFLHLKVAKNYWCEIISLCNWESPMPGAPCGKQRVGRLFLSRPSWLLCYLRNAYVHLINRVVGTKLYIFPPLSSKTPHFFSNLTFFY